MTGFTTRDREWPLGDRDCRWELFAQGGPGDRAKPTAWQVMILSDLSGADGRCAGATDDEVFGALGQWGAAGSWLEGRKLAVLRELIRRRPDERNVGTATASGLPWDWDDRLAHEIALELRISVPAARKLTWAAWALEARLPGVAQALDEGRLDLGRAKMVVEETDVLLEPDKLARAQELILAGLDKCATWTDLLRLVQRAVVTIDPDGAAKRREQEEKEHARVRFWREAAGTCALLGAGLPTDEGLQAHAHVEQRAQAYRAAGIKRPIDILRVAAYLDLLNLVPAEDRIARFAAEDAAQAAAGSPQGTPGTKHGKPGSKERDGGCHAGGTAVDGEDSGSAGSAGEGRAPEDAADEGSSGEDENGEPGDNDGDGSGPGGSSPRDGTPANDGPAGSATRDPGPPIAAEVNLTLRHLDIPMFTAAGTGQQPGEARSLGPLDPGIARRLAEAAARHPGSTFCLTITDSNGHAIAHGCCKPRRQPKARGPRHQPRGQRDGPPPPGRPETSPWTCTQSPPASAATSTSQPATTPATCSATSSTSGTACAASRPAPGTPRKPTSSMQPRSMKAARPAAATAGPPAAPAIR